MAFWFTADDGAPALQGDIFGVGHEATEDAAGLLGVGVTVVRVFIKQFKDEMFEGAGEVWVVLADGVGETVEMLVD